MKLPLLSALLCWSLMISASPLHAQDGQGEMEEASVAFNRGIEAYEGGNFEAAANWFERANALAPSETTLFAAMDSRQEQGDLRTALSHAAAFVADYPSADVDRLAAANSILEAHRGDYVEVFAPCTCELTVNSRVTTARRFFLAPNTRHQLVFTFETGAVSRTVRGEPGEQIDLEVAAPPRAEAQGSREVRTATPPTEDGGGLHPAVFAVSLAATVGLAGTLTWSGLDVLSINDEYETAVTEQRAADARTLLDEGQSAERRTNILIGVTAGMGALTVLFAVLTDWGGSDAPDSETDNEASGEDSEDSEASETETTRVHVAPTVSFGSGGGILGVAGAF